MGLPPIAEFVDAMARCGRAVKRARVSSDYLLALHGAIAASAASLGGHPVSESHDEDYQGILFGVEVWLDRGLTGSQVVMETG